MFLPCRPACDLSYLHFISDRIRESNLIKNNFCSVFDISQLAALIRFLNYSLRCGENQTAIHSSIDVPSARAGARKKERWRLTEKVYSVTSDRASWLRAHFSTIVISSYVITTRKTRERTSFCACARSLGFLRARARARRRRNPDFSCVRSRNRPLLILP